MGRAAAPFLARMPCRHRHHLTCVLLVLALLSNAVCLQGAGTHGVSARTTRGSASTKTDPSAVCAELASDPERRHVRCSVQGRQRDLYSLERLRSLRL